MAGIDGINSDVIPTGGEYGPFDDDVFKWPEERRKSIRPLPRTLTEALDCLGSDREFLLAGRVFSESLIDTYIGLKNERESGEVINRPHPYEFELYLDC